MMKILCLGDAVGESGVEALEKKLPALRRRLDADAVIVNGENAAMGKGNGMTAEHAARLFGAGADIITGGNHSFRQRNVFTLMDDSISILRPANYPAANPGRGHTVVLLAGHRMLAVNLSGRVNMEPCACPFETLEKILKAEKGNYDFAVVDFHAEATSEKIAMAYEFKDRVSIFFGTHTHVQTADEQILPSGCGFITDVGMCGPTCSALGVKIEVIIEKFKTGMPCKFELSDNPAELQGALFTLGDDFRCTAVGRVRA